MLRTFIYFLFIWAFIFPRHSFADDAVTAITADGQSVLLNADGTWQYLTIRETAVTKPTEPLKFRSFLMGTAKEKVKAGEKAKFVEETSDRLDYTTKLNNLDVYISYFFLKNKLFQGIYLFTEKHTNPNLFIDDFYSIEDMLNKKYGYEGTPDLIWKEDMMKNNQDNWGTAIQLGQLEYSQIRKFGNSTIRHVLRGDNYEAVHYLHYLDNKLHDEFSRNSEKKSLSEY